jgi:hypothetical protein
MEDEEKEKIRLQLIQSLRNVSNSLENNWMNVQAVYGWMLIELYSSGYLKKIEEHYVKEIK